MSETCACECVASTTVAMPLSRRRREVSNLQRVTQQTQQREISKYCPILFICPSSYWAQALGSATWLIYLAIRLTKPITDIIKSSLLRACVYPLVNIDISLRQPRDKECEAEGQGLNPKGGKADRGEERHDLRTT